MRFNHLNVPDSWNQHFTKYPQGFTVLESLRDWIGQVDGMIDTLNLTTAQVDAIQIYVDTEIPKLMNSVLPENLNTVLTGWLQSGYLYTTLNNMLVTRFGGDITLLQTKMTKKVGDGVQATMADLGQDVKTAMTGGSVAVVGVGSTGTTNIINKAVTAEKLADDVVTVTTRNLLDPAGYTVGGYYDKNNVWVASSMHVSSNIIPARAGDVFSRNTASGQFIMVDKNGTYIAGDDQAADKFTVSQNYFIRGVRVVLQVNPAVSGGAYVVKGSTLIKDARTLAPSFQRELRPDEIEQIAAVTNENLLTTTEQTSGGYYDATTGKWTASALHVTSNFIPVQSGELIAKLTGSGQYSFWNNRKQWIGGIDGTGTASVIKVPTDPAIMFLRTTNEIALAGKYVKRLSASTLEKFNLKADKFTISPAALDAVETIPVPNLLDYEAAEINKYYQYNTGAAVNSQFITASALIPVTTGEQMYSDTGSGQKTFWDVNNNYVTGLDVAGAFTVPLTATIKNMRVNIDAAYLNSGKAVVVRGSDIPVEKYRLPSNRFLLGEQAATDYLKPFPRVINPVLTKAHVTDRTASSVADPFIVCENGQYHMFFEVISTTGDEIGHASSYDLVDWTYTGIVLPLAQGHRSAYPNVFKVEGSWYMLPDTGAQLNLYRASTFPNSWTLINNNLVTGTGFNDTNIFQVNDVWYMTTSQNGGGIDLYQNTSGDFTNSSWTYVKKLLSNYGGYTDLRGAGNPILCDGYVIMPIQHTAGGVYGKFTKLYKLSNLGTAFVTFTDLGLFTKDAANGMWNHRSMHHAAHAEYLGNKRIFAADGNRQNGEYAIGLYLEG